jgi:CBS domain-containing protein
MQIWTGDRPMFASDVMTTNVITIAPGATVHDLAELMGKYGIS